MEMDRFPTKKSLPDEEDVDDNLIIEQNKNQRKKRQAPYLIFPEILCIIDYDGYRYICIRYTFSSNNNILQSSCGLCFRAPDPLIDVF